MRVSKDVRKLNPQLKTKDLKAAKLKPKKEPTDYNALLADQCIKAGLPPPLREVPFAKVVRLGYRADVAWNEMVIAEVNGQIWAKGGHNTGAGLKRDYFKQNLAQLLGFRYFEFSPDMVTDGSALTVLLCAFGKQETFETDWKELQPKSRRK